MPIKQKRKYKDTLPNNLIAIAIAVGALSGILIVGYAYNLYVYFSPTKHVRVVESAASLKIISVEQIKPKDPTSKEDLDGKKAFIIRLQVTNDTDAKQIFIPTNHLFLKSRDGQIAQMQPMLGVKDAIYSGPIEPGASIEGEVSFIVDATSQDFWLYLDTRWNNSMPMLAPLE